MVDALGGTIVSIATVAPMMRFGLFSDEVHWPRCSSEQSSRAFSMDGVLTRKKSFPHLLCRRLVVLSVGSSLRGGLKQVNFILLFYINNLEQCNIHSVQPHVA